MNTEWLSSLKIFFIQTKTKIFFIFINYLLPNDDYVCRFTENDIRINPSGSCVVDLLYVLDLHVEEMNDTDFRRPVVVAVTLVLQRAK